MSGNRSALENHYAVGDVVAAVEEAMARMEGETGRLPGREELGGLDQFHSGGVEATREQARESELKPGDKVLDVGGGLGGAARILAAEFGCTVLVLDPIEEYCRIGKAITDRAGLGDRVQFMVGDGLELPCGDESFDVVWTQHSTMNIADKDRLYSELRRVAKPGGRYAMLEIMEGGGGPAHFPALWATDASMSHLAQSEATRECLRRAGFREKAWVDKSAWSLVWFEAALARRPGAGVSGRPGLQLLLGPGFASMARNQVLGLREERIRVVQAVFERV